MAGDWPELRALELLVTVADMGSLSAASRTMLMAQPNASRMLTTLERQLGTVLLHRSTNGSVATRDGALVIAHARELLASAAGLLESVGTRRQERANSMTIGASLTIVEYLLPRWLATLRTILPDLRPELRAMNSSQVFAALDAGECAVGLVETPSIPRRFSHQLIQVDQLNVVVALSHPWARRGTPVSAQELAATPLITREPGSGTRKALERALSGRAMATPLQELGSNAAVLASACAGMGPAALSRLVVAGAIKAGALARVEVEDVALDRRFHAVWLAAGHLRGAPAELVRVASASETSA